MWRPLSEKEISLPEGVMHNISIVDHDVQFACPSQQSLLRGMERVAKKSIPVGCRNGGCGVCKIEILTGKYRTGLMSRACVTLEEAETGMALACRVFPEGDLSVRVVGKIGRRLETGSSSPTRI